MFKTLYGVNLPRHTNYSPLVVKPQEARGSEIVDPETGNSIANCSTFQCLAQEV